MAQQYLAGPPYPQNPAFTDAGQQLIRWKSAYYQPDLLFRDVALHRDVPLLLVYGWTDAAVPPVQVTSMLARIRSLDADWPVDLILADVGHTGQNALADWNPIHAQMRAFLDHYLRGAPLAVLAPVRSRTTTCDASTATLVQANDLRGLASDHVVLQSNSALATSSGAAVSEEPFTCQPQPIATGDTAWLWPVTQQFTTVGFGIVRSTMQVSGTDANVASRLWDVDLATGQEVLVTRGIFKHSGPGGATAVTYPLFGAAWTFRPGHGIKLEVSQADLPLFRPDPLLSSVSYSSIALTLPTAP